MSKGILSIIVCVMAAVGLLACGGGGGGSSNTNSAPVANAGPDQNIITGSLATLIGSGSSDANGDTLTYTWSFTSKPGSSTATLSSTTAVNPTFTADKNGAYVLSLVVNDGIVNSVADSVTITASTANSAPVANAGPDQNVTTGSLSTLNGSGSSDVNGDTLTYTWLFTSMPASSTATLSSTAAANPTFTTDKDGAYVLNLVVNDGIVNSVADSVTITASTTNSAPVANAGPDQNVITGSLATLIGSGSSDANGDTLTYTWSFTSKPGSSTATLSSATAVNPTFTADKTGTYVLGLVVNDGLVNSAADAVIITAVTPSPVPDTGQTGDYTATIGEDSDYTINPPSYTDNGDGTINDNVTGLVWQKCTVGQLVTACTGSTTTYNWYQASGTADATYNPGGATNVCGDLSLAGTGWRLPTEFELMTIVDYGRYNPSINTTYFPGTQTLLYYWSSVTDNSGSSPSNYAWIVDFYVSIVNSTSKTGNLNVRCVRGEQTSPVLTDNGNGTITDNVTGLMWQLQNDGVTKTWAGSLTYCEGLSLGGFNDWRLPNVKELRSVANAAKAAYFPDAQYSYSHWSSTSYIAGSPNVWYVRFGYFGAAATDNPTYLKYARCVR